MHESYCEKNVYKKLRPKCQKFQGNHEAQDPKLSFFACRRSIWPNSLYTFCDNKDQTFDYKK